LSPLAQRRHHFSVESLPRRSTLSGNIFAEALRDNTKSPPDEQATFRVDFPHWLGSLGQRARRIAEDLALGEKTQDLARKHGLSQGRISQLRRELHSDWQRFCGDVLT
jgi:DNA-binding NarL/FixJ family response regulator